MPKIGSDALRDLPVVGTLLGVVVIAALGLAYWGNVTSRERYLQSRNFRLLADVAEQSQTMLYDSEKSFAGRFPSPPVPPTSPQPTGQGLGHALGHNQLTGRSPTGRWTSRPRTNGRERSSATCRARAGMARKTNPPIGVLLRLSCGVVRRQSSHRPPACPRLQGSSDVIGRAFWVSGSDLRFEWTAADNKLPNLSFQLPAAALFSGAFNQARWDRAFSTMALATPDGRIVFAVGAQAGELKTSGVAALLPGARRRMART